MRRPGMASFGLAGLASAAFTGAEGRTLGAAAGLPFFAVGDGALCKVTDAAAVLAAGLASAVLTGVESVAGLANSTAFTGAGVLMLADVAVIGFTEAARVATGLAVSAALTGATVALCIGGLDAGLAAS